MKVTVLGDGAWGTAISRLLAEQGYCVTLWCHTVEVAQSIIKNGHNTHYFPDFMCDGIQVTTSLQEALHDVTWVFEAVPVAHLRSVLEQAKPYYRSDQVWVILSKGIEKERHLLPTFIMHDVFEHQVSTVVVSGPSYAHDLAHKKPTGIVVACSNKAVARTCAQLLTTDYLTPELSSDVVGVQLCGAFKNLIALGVGLLDGARYTDNTKALLVTRGLHEIERIVTAMGGDRNTVYGLAGIGDLVLTSLGSLSKNVALGKQLGSGQSLEDLIKNTQGVLPEGINTVHAVYALTREHRIELPICSAIHDVVIKGEPLSVLITALMA